MKSYPIILLLFLLCQSCKAQTDKEKLNTLYDLGLRADSIKDFKTSIGYYDQMLAIDSINMAGLIDRGRALVAVGKISAGFKDLNKAIKYWPNERTYFARAGTYIYLKQNPDSAEKDLNAAIRLNVEPNFTDPYYALSYLVMNRGKYLVALNYCETADKRSVQKGASNFIKTELGKKIGADVVANYNYNKIIGTVKDLPKVKNVEDSLLKKAYHGLTINPDFDSTYKYYIIKVGDSYDDVISNKCRFVFKMDAVTLSVLNPAGKLE